MSQLKIDQLFKIVEKTRISDDNKNDLPSAKVDVAEVTIDLTNEEPPKPQKVAKPKDFRIRCLSSLAELGEKLEKNKVRNNLEAVKKEIRQTKKKVWTNRRNKPDEDEWFYMYCDSSCEPDCDAHYKIDSVMENESQEARIRVDFYRTQSMNKSTNDDCPVEYIFGYERKRGTDYYKVKWAGWPKEAWSWVKSIDIDAEPINDFQRAVLAKLPMRAWPTNQQNYQIPEQYRDEIKSNYEINKIRQREELDRKQQLLRRLDPTVLLENEEDNDSFPDFDFITSTEYHSTSKPSLEPDLFPCKGSHCGFCTKEWHCYLDLNWYHKFPKDSEFIQHYTEVDNQLLAKHGNKNVIFECTQNCRCVQEGTCKNNAMMRLAQNPLPFVIFKCDNSKGWGLKCLRKIKKGEAVIEYLGERMAVSEFHKREASQEQSSAVYCINLTHEDPHDVEHCIDSANRGNHARFINHACRNGANLSLYRVYTDERCINRPRAVLFARRDIKIGEELTFDYQMITEEKVGDEGDVDEQLYDVSSANRQFPCECQIKGQCRNYRWAPGEKEADEAHKRKLKLKREKAREKKRKASQSNTTPKDRFKLFIRKIVILRLPLLTRIQQKRSKMDR